MVALALCLLAVPARAQDALTHRTLYVGEFTASQDLAGLAPGVGEWLRVELDGAGLRVAPRASAPAADSPPGLRLVGELRGGNGRVEIRLRLHDTATGALVAGVSERGQVGELGSLTQLAGAALLRRIGYPGERLLDAATPNVAQFGRASRSLLWLERGDLVRAWEEIGDRADGTAASLRAEIQDAALDRELTSAERARLLVAQGDADAAWQEVSAELSTTRDARVVLAGAEAARARQNPRRSSALFHQAVELDPNLPDAQRGLGEALGEARRTEAARRALLRAAALDPDNPEPLEALARIEEKDPQRRAELLVEAALRSQKRFEPRRAQRHYEAARPNAPAEVARHSGELYESLGDYEGARVAYERAVELGAADSDVWRGLGRTRGEAGDKTGSEQAWLQALASDDDDPEALRELGTLLIRSDREEEGIPLLEQAVAVAPRDDEARLALARGHQAIGDTDGALALLEADPSDSPLVLEGAAEIHLAQGDGAAAVEALELAHELDPGDGELATQLARAYELQGQGSKANAARREAELLAGLDVVGEADAGEDVFMALTNPFDDVVTSFPDRNPASAERIRRVALLGVRADGHWQAQLRTWLAPLAMERARVEADLRNALAGRWELAHPEAPVVADALARIRAFQAGADEIMDANLALETDALFVARLQEGARPLGSDGSRAPRRVSVEVQLLAGNAPETVSALGNAILLDPTNPRYRIWNVRALGIYGVLFALFVFRVVRGGGRALVRIRCETVGRGFFTIRFSRKPGQAKQRSKRREANKVRRFQTRVRMSRFQRTIAGREALFRWLPARELYVSVHGLFEDPSTHEVIGNYLEEKKVRIQRRDTTVVQFDFTQDECCAEVVVSRGPERVSQAMVAVRGQPGSLRFTRDGVAHLYLKKGQHAILAGLDDRVVERRIRINSIEPTSVALDLDDENSQLFRDCPEAVEPFLQSAFEVAAEHLERAGHEQIALSLRADVESGRGDAASAAAHLEAAGRHGEAARLQQEMGNHVKAAELLESEGDFAAAGEAWQQAGDPLRAAQAYEQAYDYEAAIECYRAAGDLDALMLLLEKTDAYIEAAEVAMKLEQWDRAIEHLQRIEPRDREYGPACRHLGEIFSRRGERGLAIDKYQEAASLAGEERAPLDLLDCLATLLEAEERFDEAVEVWEEIRRRDFHHPGAAERVESVKRRLSERHATRAAVSTMMPGGPGSGGESRYEILGELGRGGMGVVYRAKDRRLERIVALKRLPENLRDHPKAVQLFLREARAVAALNHANVVTVHDVDQENNCYFITMECLDGFPLNTILKKRKRLQPRDVARIGLQVCNGLQVAHDRNIVHRDVKTSNLFITRDRVVKIMDFGLAKTMEEVRAAASMIAGTPNYMAPEQVSGGVVDHRADLYALGATFFELLTGRVVFPEGQAAQHHLNTPPPDPRELVEDCPDVLAELILSLLAKSPDDRPQSAAEVGQVLGTLLRETR